MDCTLQRLRESYMRLYETEKLKGGLADNKSLEDIAEHHGVSIEEIKKQYDIGVKVEMEHTDDAKVAGEVCRDHLWEDEAYYTNLKKVEKK